MKNFNEISENFWIDANAGSGKTTMIIKRLTSLLISGVDHKKIIAITYTNVAADEMKSRLFSELKKISLMRKEEIEDYFYNQIGLKFNPDRELFYKSLYLNINPDEITITTIHKFCTKIINSQKHLFKIPQDYKIANDILINFIQNKTKNEIMAEIAKSSLDKITMLSLNYSIYEDINLFILNNLSKLKNVEISNFNEKLENFLEIQLHTYEDVFNKYSKVINKENLKIISTINCNIDSNDYKKILKIKKINNIEFSLENFFYQICQCFVKSSDKSKYKNFLTKETQKNNNPHKIALLEKVIDSAFNALIDFNKIVLLKVSLLAKANLKNIITKETELKKNFITYDDILDVFYNSLCNDNNISLLYDLSFKIDHLVIDESQDTSPISWKIICKIIDECVFENSNNSSIFIVGDQKQSIFSFQGASFESNVFFKNKINQILESKGKTMHSGFLNKNYRSDKKILKNVDEFIANSYSKFNINSNHEPHSEKEGNVSLIKIEDYSIKASDSKEVKWLELLDKKEDIFISKTIQIVKDLINQGEKESDIMILFTSRQYQNKLPYRLIDEMKNNNLSVNEIDRFPLNDHIIFYDVLSLLKFINQPYLNSNLTALIRSPVFDKSISAIFELNKNRKKKPLLLFLKTISHPIFKELDEIIKLYEYKSTNQVIQKVFLSEIVSKRYFNLYGKIFFQIIDSILNLITTIEEVYFNKKSDEIHDIMKNISIQMQNKIDHDKIQIKTIHGSKGLESKNVIFFQNEKKYKQEKIIYLNQEDIFIPYVSSIKNIYQFEKAKQNAKYNNEFEEFRLHYVALTRARNNLFIINS